MKNLSLIYLGITIGLVLGYFIQPFEIKYVIIFGVFAVLYSNEKLMEFVSFLFLVTLCLVYPMLIMLTGIEWYEPLLLLWVMFVLFYNTFKDIKKPIFVNEGDISLFPVVFDWKGKTVDTRDNKNGLIIGEYGDGTFDVLFDKGVVKGVDVSEIFKVY